MLGASFWKCTNFVALLSPAEKVDGAVGVEKIEV
jgi:hypothetical protein